MIRGPDGQPVVQLKGITMGREPASGMDRFYQQLDALTIKDLGATIRFDFIPWGDEKNQISRAIASKEYDPMSEVRGLISHLCCEECIRESDAIAGSGTGSRIAL